MDTFSLQQQMRKTNHAEKTKTSTNYRNMGAS